MSLFITSLNSGSNGNCYYIGNEVEAVLIDAGISCRETEKRMKHLGLSMKLVRAIFISHEHIDHIKGVPAIAEKYSIPVYVTSSTLSNGIGVKRHGAREFSGYVPIQIGQLTITAFPKFHDACDPHSFLISSKDVTVGVFTDIGATCPHVIKNFNKCHAAFLEANYDDDLLENGRYPWYLKNRIRGGKGHLSNKQALEIFLAHRPNHMSHLLLAHLSKENNSPELVQRLFDPHAGNIKIAIASRYEASLVYNIRANGIQNSVKAYFFTQLNMFAQS